MDNILTKVGEFGLYQKRVFALLCWSTLFSGLYDMMSVILLYAPDHRCKIPGLENDTYDIHSAYQQNLVNNYIPASTDDDTLDYDQCHLYSFDDTTVKFDNSNRPINASLVKCTEWVYSDSVFKETFSSKYNIVCDDTHLIPLVKALFVVGKFVGAFVFGNLSDLVGRKTTHCVALTMMFCLTFCISWSPSYIMLAVFMTAVGATTQGIFPVGLVLGVELVGPSKRKYASPVFLYFFSVGLVILAGVSYFVRDWYYINIICSTPTVLFLLYWWALPKSPRWLISKHRYQEANVILQKAAKVNKRPIERNLFDERVESETPKPTGKLWQLFSTRVMLLRTLVICFNWCMAGMAYYGLSVNAGNIGGNFYLNMFLSGLVEFPAQIIVMLLVDRAGRKKVYCVSMIFGGCICASTMIPILYGEMENQTAITTLAMIGKCFASVAYTTIYLFSSELLPTVVRNAGLGASLCAARIGGVVASYVADATALIGGRVGKLLPFGVFGVMSVVAGLSALQLPETVNRTLPETIEDGILFGKSASRPHQESKNKKTEQHKETCYSNSGYLPETEISRF